jgi:PTH1 family peptidyl-tRNA hydrolase
MKLIAGLGNKGKEYDKTRHNVGFIFLDYFYDDLKIKSIEKNKLSVFFKKTINNEKVLFLKPSTYMNLSGKAVCFFANKYKISVSDVLIIHDDIDLPFAKIKIKKGGGDAGHKGIKSITEELGHDDFCRIRIGIGRPEEKGMEADYVLDKFTKEEEKMFVEKFPVVKDFVYNWITYGYEKAAGRFKDA